MGGFRRSLKMIKLIIFLLIATFSTVNAQIAKFEELSKEQLSKELNAKGGNYKIDFNKELYCGFVRLLTDEDGNEVSNYLYSSTKSAKHEFSYMVTPLKNAGGLRKHENEFDILLSNKLYYKNGNTSGYSFSWHQFIPDIKGTQIHLGQGEHRVNKEEAELLYSWSSASSKRSIKVYVFFTDKKSSYKIKENKSK